jgi:hypothetical protein
MLTIVLDYDRFLDMNRIYRLKSMRMMEPQRALMRHLQKRNISHFHAGEAFRVYLDQFVTMGLAKIVIRYGKYPYYRATFKGRHIRIRKSMRRVVV